MVPPETVAAASDDDVALLLAAEVSVEVDARFPMEKVTKDEESRSDRQRVRERKRMGLVKRAFGFRLKHAKERNTLVLLINLLVPLLINSLLYSTLSVGTASPQPLSDRSMEGKGRRTRTGFEAVIAGVLLC